ncbi:DUF2066 domain-containing protein [Denitratimonas tolerans]|uniref:DUF2066 domain-containing protein n=1 Tax=Denitratimonas tolerans TaxID=1338420 RepID=A0AAW9R475_9GAMM
MARACSSFRLFLLVLLAIAPCLPALAQVIGPYEGEVAVASQSDADREAALPQALAQVLARAGAAPDATHGADAAGLLQQYRYRQEVVDVDGVPTRRLYLIARFDAAGVQHLLAAGGGVAAPPRRVQAILWLAIDDGSGARIVSQSAAAAVLPLTTRASQRGLRLRLPAWDARDQAAVRALDLAGEDSYAVDTATRRYGGPALIGWLRRDGGGWVVDWRLRDGESEIGRWQNRDPQAAAVLAAGADGAADALVRRLAQVTLSGPAGTYRIVVQGLGSAADYARVLATLRRQTIVRAVSPVALAADRVELDVELGAGVGSLAQLLAGGPLESTSVGDQRAPSVFSLRR